MTARRLYDRYCDAVARGRGGHYVNGEWVKREPLLAWPFLSDRERSVWREMTRAIRDRKNYA